MIIKFYSLNNSNNYPYSDQNGLNLKFILYANSQIFIKFIAYQLIKHMYTSEKEQFGSSKKVKQMLSTPTKNKKLFDYNNQHSSSSKLNGEVTAQGAIGSFFARSNSKAKQINLLPPRVVADPYQSNSRIDGLKNLQSQQVSTIPDDDNTLSNSKNGGLYDSFHGRRKSHGGVESHSKPKHLPQIGGAKHLNMVATLPSGLCNSITRVDSDSNDVRVRRVIKQKRPTCPDPIEMGQKLDEGNSECITPTKTKQSDQEDGELLGDDSSNEKQSKNSDGDESNTDEDEDDEAEQEQLAKDQQKELEELK